MLRFLPLLILCFALAACGGDASDPEPVEPDEGAMQGAPPAPEPAEPEMVNGVQVVEIEVGPMGYDPRAIRLERGVPARLVFTRTVDSECSSQVQIPAFDVPVTDLPMNEPVAVEFTPTETGDFEFVCGMDMQRGSLLIQS
jgi:plastocyanin domain-containing protein